MKKEIGIWIDHHKAVIIILTLKEEVLLRIENANDSAGSDSQPGTNDKYFAAWLEGYYAKVISYIRTAESVLIFGPGEAKRELEERMKRLGLEDHIVDIQPDEDMTDRQISAKVNRYFPNQRRPKFKPGETPANYP